MKEEQKNARKRQGTRTGIQKIFSGSEDDANIVKILSRSQDEELETPEQKAEEKKKIDKQWKRLKESMQ